MGGCKEEGDILFSVVASTRANGQKLRHGIFCWDIKKQFYCTSAQTLEQVAQRSYGVSILGDFRYLHRHSPEQSVVTDSA